MNGIILRTNGQRNVDLWSAHESAFGARTPSSARTHGNEQADVGVRAPMIGRFLTSMHRQDTVDSAHELCRLSDDERIARP